MHLANIEAMYRAVEEGRGFDVIVVISPTKEQADFWRERLEGSRGTITGEKTKIFSLEENWPGGAGQLLGTLYAWKNLKAQGLGDLLSQGGKVAFYHTAGKGMRLSPLPMAEGGNKSAVKLPRSIEVNGQKVYLTILESVIFQTGIFAPSREGRLCVFWGDQIFIPEKSPEFAGDSAAEIFDIRQEVPKSKEKWKRDWQSYGLLLPTENGEVLQREKQTWAEIEKLKEKGLIRPGLSGKIILGKSLGSFTISYSFLKALLEEFRPELEKKKGKLDTDPHLWMPLSSSWEDFVLQGGDSALWKRVNQLKESFQSSKLLVDKDLGEKTFWWDFGQIKFYRQNLLRLLEDSYEGECLRKFFNLRKCWIKSFKSGKLKVENSILLNSKVTGEVEESLLLGVNSDELKSHRSVVVDSCISNFEAKEALVYGCVELENLALQPDEAAADVFLPQGKVRMKTELGRDGKKDWSQRLPGNFYSYKELFPISQGTAKEREQWKGYYQDRQVLRELVSSLKSQFIKPETNLVERVWGGDYIEKLKGFPPSGRRIGESWECSAHPQHPSTIKAGNLEIPLPHLLSLMDREVLGEAIAQEFKGQLPILIKFIDAKENLSVQVHPSDNKAQELGENDTGKNEAWVILYAEEGAVMYLGFKEDVGRDEFERALSSGDTNIAERFLNAIPVRAGDVLFNPAGTAHAIGKGIFLAEIQQSSGVTYRVWDWNRVPQRTLHIPQAMESLNFKKSSRKDFELTPFQLSENEERLIDSLNFTVDCLTLKSGQELAEETGGVSRILTCLSGKVELASEGSTERLLQGESLLVPASLENYRIRAQKDSILLKSFVLTSQHIDPIIFQTYDVRAIADKYLTDRVCYYLGKGYGTFLKRNLAPDRGSWVVVGGGIRLTTGRIRRQVINGLLSTGVNVYDVGTTSTPEMYFSVPYLDADGGINITASHNEAEYNGLKQVIRSEDGFITSITADQMLQIKGIILSGDFVNGRGEYRGIEDGEVANYHNELVKANCRLGRDIWIYLLQKWGDRGLKPLLDTTSQLDFPETLDDTKWSEIKQALDIPADFEQPPTAVRHPLQGLKTVIDFGSGSAWRTKAVYSDLGAEVVAINDIPDGSFPSHIPDPIKAKYRKELEDKVKEVASQESTVDSPKEVVGIGHDEDGDRVIYVRADGQVVEGDRTLAMQAKHMIEEHYRKGHTGKPRFMGEVKFSKATEEFITSQGGEYIITPTGFAFIKEGIKTLIRALRDGLPEAKLPGGTVDLRENKEPVLLAAEFSGHQLSGHEENWIFDDGTFAAVKVLTAIASGLKEGKSFIDLDEEIPRYPVSPEINIRLPINVLSEKQEVVDKIVEVFANKGYSIDTIDGGLIKWVDGEGNWLGQALVRKSNTQPMLICRVEGKDEEVRKTTEDEFFGELRSISTEMVPRLDLASDEYIMEIMPRILKSQERS